MADWPQAAGNAQRTAFQPTETLAGTTWTLRWRVQFQQEFTPIEKLVQAVQPIISAGRVLISSVVPGASPTGRLRGYPIGSTKLTPWNVDVGAFSYGSPAADATNVYVADVLGRISAFKIADGTRAVGWPAAVQVTDGRPFHGSLLLADNKLMIGGTDGKFYGRSLSNGANVWASYNVGSPILQTPAWSNTTGTGIAVVGAMNGRVYGINSATGALVWATPARLPNAALFRDFWPAIHGTGAAARVYIRPIVQAPFYTSGEPIQLATPIGGIRPPDGETMDPVGQTNVLNAYAASPSSYSRSLFVLDLATGTDDPTHQMMHWYQPVCITGAPAPPCIDAAGRLILGFERPGSMAGVATAAYGRVDPATRKYTDYLLPSQTNITGPSGNRDENVVPSACANGVLLMHMMETNAFPTGFFRQTDSTWHPFALGAGGGRLQNANEAGASPGAISGGLVYHVAHPHTMTVWGST